MRLGERTGRTTATAPRADLHIVVLVHLDQLPRPAAGSALEWNRGAGPDTLLPMHRVEQTGELVRGELVDGRPVHVDTGRLTQVLDVRLGIVLAWGRVPLDSLRDRRVAVPAGKQGLLRGVARRRVGKDRVRAGLPDGAVVRGERPGDQVAGIVGAPGERTVHSDLVVVDHVPVHRVDVA